ncbi:50S ribosomal protein L9 [Candidatus Schneideria nysicola]|uniref:50S ribosomal protein L9 n=1 Tax=Candidatus Schneideria nysicola TaxID=1081631 RepID=UPI001CAA6A00|nr:50S ribosomal protein L9 [Candidatus Schneideria nysicola]UAJ65035.1 50S ribosomal protein L9 [Candidatus Schneideria nysicola]UAJ66095.1 50S ribosomal protein L9 [Candidatus Schneideria nysicola]
MRIILLEKIKQIGNLGEEVSVKGGYARNFLIPRGKALPATKKNIIYVNNSRNHIQSELLKKLDDAKERAKKINNLLGDVITIFSKVGKEGKLFGSVGIRDIAHALNTAGISISKREIKLPNGILRTAGTYPVKIHLHNDVIVNLTVIITNKI